MPIGAQAGGRKGAAVAKRATIREIAAEAGVSTATVSRVINSSAGVDDATRNRVMEVVQRHRYSPSSAARSLSSQNSRTIGIIVPEIDNPFFGKMMQIIATLADENRYTLVCFSTENKARKDLQALEMLGTDRARGLIYAPSLDVNQPEMLASLSQLLDDMDTPVVVVDRVLDYPRADRVLFEDEQAAYLATRILIAAGHTRIGFIGGTPGVSVAQRRLAGYLQALREKGLAPEEGAIFEGDFTVPTAYRLSKHMLQMEMRPTAVITCNNTTSLGYFQASTEDGGLGAQTIEHIGFGELEALNYLHFEYNHITHNVEKLAGEAMNLLLARFDNSQRAHETLVLPRQFKLNSRLSQIALRNGILTAGQLLDATV